MGVDRCTGNASEFALAGCGYIGVHVDPLLAHHDGRIPDFFEPVKLHFETSNLAVEALWLTLCVNRLGATLALEQGLGLLLDGFLPQPDLHRVDIKFLANLVDGFATT